MDVYFRAAAAIEAEVESGLGREAAKLYKKYPRRKDLPLLDVNGGVDEEGSVRKSWILKSSNLRLLVYRIAMNGMFDQLIAGSIILNVLAPRSAVQFASL